MFIPRAVFNEMQHEKAPKIVSDWVGDLPEWVEVAEAIYVDETLNLGAGEKEALALAKEKGSPILIDERRGRSVALDIGLAPISTLNVLEEAAVAGLIEIDDALRKLELTNFHWKPELMESVRARVLRRKP